ncbi:gamma-glutamylcyclotransferase [Clavibacter michiganensis]|nr:gamma-glutamylcyclotransferase [Clavibacter michiganensis]
MTVSEVVFSFGTLQLADVQLALFGRTVDAVPDALTGFVIGELRIVDPEVIAMSGSDLHPALLLGEDDDLVPGVALELTPGELAAADHYERVSYRRVKASLVSGRAAWVYVPR